MADARADQWRPEVGEGAEAAVKPITTINVLDISDILEFDDNIDETTSRKDEILYETSASRWEIGESSNNDGEVVEEEIVELEFEKVKPKLATCSMHCPNCKSEITKVILRRKVVSHRSMDQTVDPSEPEPDQRDLVGCFSCLSLFTCLENGCFNPFDIFQRRLETGMDPASVKAVVRENESCFSMFWVVGKQQNDLKQDPPQPDTVLTSSDQVQVPKYDNLKLEEPRQPGPLYVNRQSIIRPDQVQAPKYNTGNDSDLKVPLQPEVMYVNRQSIINSDQIQAPKHFIGIAKGTSQLLSSDLPESSNATGEEYDDAMITIENKPGTVAVVAQSRARPWLGYEGVLVEIIKSIVYGGLMEVIASLSVVASAAASDAATLSIVSLALASLVGGVFIIGHNLWDLRDDCYKDSSSQETNKAATNKYKELLGQVNYFPLHTFFAILSFLMFGMVPPVAYGYSYHETRDKDFTLIVAATVSLLCVLLLAILKTYINKCTVLEYFKTVVYYIIIAVLVSGVSYLVGNLVSSLMEELGWFNTSSGGDIPCLPRASTPYLETF